MPAAGPSSFRLFGAAATTPAVDVLLDDVAWVRAMVRFEAALARAAGDVRLVDLRTARTAADVLDGVAADPAGQLDLEALAHGTATAATPVVELVRQLRALVPQDARAAVHVGATSQDVLDTALVLVARDVLDEVVTTAADVSILLRDLALAHRETVMVGRTLLQHGEPTTFGALAAVRYDAVGSALMHLDLTFSAELALQLGGPVGTLSGLGGGGRELAEVVAQYLALPLPAVPWHAVRGRLARVCAATGILVGELAATAHDVVLLSSTDVGEVSVAAPGGSSAMPHKQNPSRAVLALAAAHRVPGLVATVLAGMPGDLQRAAGSWQAEPGTVTDLLRLAAATAEHTRATLDGLVVHTDRMRAAVDALLARTGGTADVAAAAAVVDRALAPPGQEQG